MEPTSINFFLLKDKKCSCQCARPRHERTDYLNRIGPNNTKFIMIEGTQAWTVNRPNRVYIVDLSFFLVPKTPVLSTHNKMAWWFRALQFYYCTHLKFYCCTHLNHGQWSNAATMNLAKCIHPIGSLFFLVPKTAVLSNRNKMAWLCTFPFYYCIHLNHGHWSNVAGMNLAKCVRPIRGLFFLGPKTTVLSKYKFITGWHGFASHFIIAYIATMDSDPMRPRWI